MPPKKQQAPESKKVGGLFCAAHKGNPRLQGSKVMGEGVKVESSENKGGMAYGRHAKMPVLASDIYAEVELPNLDEFNPDDIKIDATICAIGKRRTGKSWVFRNLMYLLKDKFPAGLVISQTDELNHWWRDYVPKKYIYQKYDPEIIQAVFRRQKKILNDVNKTDEEKDKEAPFFILLDDVVSDQRLKYDEALMELFVAGRHYRIMTLITTQYAKGITPILRANTDFVFMMKCIQQRQVEALWEDFAGFVTKDAFVQILHAFTEDNEVLVVNTCPDTQVEPLSMLKWWKAEDPGPFKMGSVEFWRSAELGNEQIPPRSTTIQASDLLNVKQIMPRPWDNFATERGST